MRAGLEVLRQARRPGVRALLDVIGAGIGAMPDAPEWGDAGADTFEVWADVARRYRLDPDWTAIGEAFFPAPVTRVRSVRWVFGVR